MMPHIRTRLVGSSPVVGSSKKSTGRAGHEARREVEAPAHAARVALEDPVAGLGEVELVEQVAAPWPAPRPGAARSGGRS